MTWWNMKSASVDTLSSRANQLLWGCFRCRICESVFGADPRSLGRDLQKGEESGDRDLRAYRPASSAVTVLLARRALCSQIAGDGRGRATGGEWSHNGRKMTRNSSVKNTKDLFRVLMSGGKLDFLSIVLCGESNIACHEAN